MATRTIVTLSVEVHDLQPYDDDITTGCVRADAAKRALHTVACLNRSDFRVVGTPKVTLVMEDK